MTPTQTTYYNTHGHPMPWTEFVELEVRERGNYPMREVNSWKKKYNIKPTDKLIWVAETPQAALTYMADADSHDEIHLPLAEFEKKWGVSAGHLAEYSVPADGFLIPESNDGDNGFLMVIERDEEALRKWAEQTWAQKSEAKKEGLVAIGNKIKKAIKSKAGYALLDADKELSGSTWSAGACLPLALAIKKVFGGNLVVIKNRVNGVVVVQHVMVEDKDGFGYLDADGFGTGYQKLKIAEEEMVFNAEISENFQPADLKQLGQGKPGFVEKVAEFLKSKMEEGGMVTYYARPQTGLEKGGPLTKYEQLEAWQMPFSIFKQISYAHVAKDFLHKKPGMPPCAYSTVQWGGAHPSGSGYLFDRTSFECSKVAAQRDVWFTQVQDAFMNWKYHNAVKDGTMTYDFAKQILTEAKIPLVTTFTDLQPIAGPLAILTPKEGDNCTFTIAGQTLPTTYIFVNGNWGFNFKGEWNAAQSGGVQERITQIWAQQQMQNLEEKLRQLVEMLR